MTKRIFLIFICLLWAAMTLAQNTVEFTATNVVNSKGAKVTATINFAPVDNNGKAISYQIGGGGQAIFKPIACNVANGIISDCFLPNTDLTNPQHVCFQTWINDRSGAILLGSKTSTDKTGYHCLQPAVANDWCSNAICNFDNYVPSSVSFPVQGSGGTATVNIGSTSTTEPGTEASVTNSGTPTAAVLNFFIPRGEKGEKGDPGTNATITAKTCNGTDKFSAVDSSGNFTCTVDQSSAGSSSYPGVSSDGANGLSVVGKVSASSIESTSTDPTLVQFKQQTGVPTIDVGFDGAIYIGVDGLLHCMFSSSGSCLGALAAKNAVDYTSSDITNKPTLGAAASKAVSGNTATVASTSGSLTANKQATFDANGNLIASIYDTGAPGSGSVNWGAIGGTISSQTDLQTALNAKANTSQLPANTPVVAQKWLTSYDATTHTFGQVQPSCGDLSNAGAACQKAVGTTAGTVAAGDHNHAGVYEPAFATLSKAKGGTGQDNSSLTFPSAGVVSVTIASGTSAMGTSAIASGACATTVTTTATGTATTDTILADFNASPLAVTGYAPTVNGILTIIKWPTSNAVNFSVCNYTAASITPGAITLNWRVVR